jgi:hypothetical protein
MNDLSRPSTSSNPRNAVSVPPEDCGVMMASLPLSDLS